MQYYRADAVAIEAFGEGESISWEVRDDLIVLAPDGATSGIIFYPGGKVEHTAYLPLMKALAAKGVLCVIVSMPLRLAVLDINAAHGIREQYPNIAHWYMCGAQKGDGIPSITNEEQIDITAHAIFAMVNRE